MSKFPWQGLRVRVHPLFWLVVCSAVWTGHFIEIITLFVLVIIHELGHVTAAWSYGWRIHSLELLPFGGVAKMEEWGTVPAHEEMVVALAGPFHHIFMVLLSFLFFVTGWWPLDWMEYFVQCNLILLSFNLLPIYPLDGGRVVQSLLSYVLPYRTCINWTLGLGFIFSLAMAVVSFLIPGSVVILHLLLIALFLLFSNWIAYRQRNYQYMRFLIQRRERGIPHGLPIHTIRVNGETPLSVVVKRLYKEKYHVVEVMNNAGKAIGFLPEERLLEAYFGEQNTRCMMRELVG